MQAICVLLSAIAFGAFGPSLSAIALEKQDGQCQAAIDGARSRLNGFKNVRVNSVDRFNLAESYAQIPRGRSQSIEFTLTGAGAPSVMNSPAVLTAIAKQSLNGCGNIGLVDFGLDQTDWVRSFGIFFDGRVGEFRCIDPGTFSGKLLWGTQICL